MHTKKYVAILVAILPSCCVAGIPIDVLLMGGQSNMVGYGRVDDLPSYLAIPQNNIKYYNGTDYAPSLGALRPNGDGTFGSELTLGWTLEHAHPDRSFGIIKYAIGGTTLYYDWNPTLDYPSGSSWRGFVSSIDMGLAAMAASGYEPHIIGMCWIQGEGDAAWSTTNNFMADSYEKNLTNFIGAMRALYGNIPFVIGGIGNGGGARDEVMNAQIAVANNVSNVNYFTNDDINAELKLHYNSDELMIIGQRFADNLEIIPEPSTSMLATLLVSLAMSFRKRSIILR